MYKLAIYGLYGSKEDICRCVCMIPDVYFCPAMLVQLSVALLHDDLFPYFGTLISASLSKLGLKLYVSALKCGPPCFHLSGATESEDMLMQILHMKR